LKAAKKLGLDSVPVIRRSDLSEAQVKALRLADNRVAESDWDEELLDVELEGLKEQDFDLELTGFSEQEITEFEDMFTEVEEVKAENPDEVETDIKKGDVFKLGRHRLMCGDATNKDHVEALMDGEKADMVFTDPPYSSGGYQEAGKTSGSIGTRGEEEITRDNLSTRGYKKLMKDVISLLDELHTIFIFCDWKMWIENYDLAERAGFKVRNMLVWNKEKMGMGMPFRNQHELILFGSKIAGKIADGSTPNVLSFERAKNDLHPTVKPVKLICEVVSQIDGNNIYDPFGGSGSTLIAAEQLDRKCYMMEIDPQYCQVIINRWEELTGKTAEKVA